jgi:DNA repair protein RadA/Sms
MARPQSRYVCQSCGAVAPRWAGRCEACGGWNSMVEEAVPSGPAKAPKASGRKLDFVALDGASTPLVRRSTGIAEFDRVTGGGLVPGSALLVGGDPGIGKSTLLLQAAARMALPGPSGAAARVAYISGEEAIDQLRLRARRLGVADSPVRLAAATAVGDILGALDSSDAPDIAIVDSIQTLYVDGLESAPGTVAQVRAAAGELIRVAKRRGFALLIVGHVTKEGTIAGPRVLEHMVDAVLYFEGERGHQFRILRAVKNRFGATDEIGVFEMTDRGLQEVANPSALFLAERHDHETVSGAAVFAGIEGTRPLLVEIQALVGPAPYGTPRRAVVGWDSGRLAMVMAVLEARCGVSLAGRDVYLNVAGGLRISEPAADLAVAAALVSALTGVPVPGDAVIFGEVGLSGEVRPVGQMENRLKEARKLGFASAWLPRRRQGRAGNPGGDAPGLVEISRLDELVAKLADDGAAAPPRAAMG